MTAIFLAAAGFASWLVSTLGGGGGEFVLILSVTYLLGANAVAPVVTLGNLLAVPSRVWLFRRHIDWRIVRWFLAGAIPGGLLGAWLFTHAELGWLQLLIALFLLSAPLQYRWGTRQATFRMRLWGFLPAGFAVAVLSGLIGGTGPVLNPLYLNFGVVKEDMIGTKSFNSFVMHVTKAGTYATLGALRPDYLLYGMAIGAAATVANWLGRRWLRRLSDRRFRQLVVWFMAASGIALLWQNRDVFGL